MVEERRNAAPVEEWRPPSLVIGLIGAHVWRHLRPSGHHRARLGAVTGVHWGLFGWRRVERYPLERDPSTPMILKGSLKRHHFIRTNRQPERCELECFLKRFWGVLKRIRYECSIDGCSLAARKNSQRVQVPNIEGLWFQKPYH